MAVMASQANPSGSADTDASFTCALQAWVAMADSEGDGLIYKTKDGRQRLVVADCLEAFKDLDDRSVDLVVTSPPYNIGLSYRSYDDSRKESEYHQWLGAVYAEVKRVLKTDGSFFLNFGAQSKDPWISLDAAIPGRDLFVLQNRIIWLKSVAIGDESRGHFKPINSKRFLNNLYEEIFHFTLYGDVEIDRLAVGVPFADKSNVKRWGHKQDRRCRGNVWFLPYKTVQSKSQKHNHPATFPVELAENCIKLHGFTEDTHLVDPFAGTGSSLVAAQRLGIKGTGFEIDPSYAEAAISRLGEPEQVD